MTYDPRYKKMKMSGAKKLWLVLVAFYFVCIIAIVYIWLYYNKNIQKTESDLLETENSADAIIKDQLDTDSEFGGKKIGELVDHMVKSARPEEESQTDTSSFVKDRLDTVYEFGGKKIGELAEGIKDGFPFVTSCRNSQ